MKTARFAEYVRAGRFQSDYAGHHPEMNLALFMKYSKVAYTANLRLFKGAIVKDLSGLEMYKGLADGRHEGLVELPPESADEELRTRLLGLDNMGIIPKFIINHRASQNFEKADRVYDCAHLHDFSRKNRILPFISWKSIGPLRPRVV